MKEPIQAKCLTHSCPKKDYCKTYQIKHEPGMSRAVYQFVDFKGLVICDYFIFQPGDENGINKTSDKISKKTSVEDS